MKTTALITGGTRGIGFGIAQTLAARNSNVAIMDIHSAEDIHPALDELEQLGAETLYCRGDVAQAADREQTVKSVIEHFGSLNFLVNNAGVAPNVRSDLLDASEESFDRLISINLKGPYFLTQLVAKQMVQMKLTSPETPACIINISSISATVASINRGDYCISKAGVSMATKLWASRLGEYDIPVYEIRPGIIKTDMTSGVQKKYDRLLDEGLCIQSRWGLPADIGKAVAMLTDGDLPYSTGQVIFVDGGLTLQRL